MNPFKNLHHPLSLYELAKRWGVTREEAIRKANAHRDKIPAYRKVHCILDPLSGSVRYVYGMNINKALDVEVDEAGDEAICFDHNDVKAFEIFTDSHGYTERGADKGPSAGSILDRAKQLLISCKTKERKFLEAYIFREESGCTVQELAEQISRSKRTAELYLTEARTLLAHSEP